MKHLVFDLIWGAATCFLSDEEFWLWSSGKMVKEDLIVEDIDMMSGKMKLIIEKIMNFAHMAFLTFKWVSLKGGYSLSCLVMFRFHRSKCYLSPCFIYDVRSHNQDCSSHLAHLFIITIRQGWFPDGHCSVASLTSWVKFSWFSFSELCCAFMQYSLSWQLWNLMCSIFPL